MLRFRFLFCLALLLAVTHAQSASLIELNDGTRIVGEVVSADRSSYLVRSQALGEIRLDASTIRTIHPTREATAKPSRPIELARIQEKIANSPELMQMISELQSNPSLQAVLNDAPLRQLVLSGDLQALQQDPRIQQLLVEPSVQAIIREVLGE